MSKKSEQSFVTAENIKFEDNNDYNFDGNNGIRNHSDNTMNLSNNNVVPDGNYEEDEFENKNINSDDDDDDDDDFSEDNNDNDDDNNDDSSSINNELIINTLSSYVSENGSHDEDLPTYKAKMKILLEQLMIKLEEDVDYQKNLEHQIDEFEKELNEKNLIIEKLTKQANDSIEECKAQTDELADTMMIKIKTERERRKALEKVVVRIQNDNARLEVFITNIIKFLIFINIYFYFLNIRVNYEYKNFFN
jgi:hypothetical protein